MQRRTSLVAVVGAGILAISGLLAGCAPAADTPATGGSLTIADTLDSSLSALTLDACATWRTECQAVYDTLVTANNSIGWEAQPSLAESWEWSEGNTVLTLHLRQGVVFSDGEKFDSAAAKGSFDAYRQTGSLKDVYFSGITSIDTPDDATLVITLKAPDTSFLRYLAYTPAMVAPDALKDPASLATNPIGTAGYTLKSATATTAVFEKNPTSWRAADLPYDTVTIKALSDPTAALNALISGQVDFAKIDATAATHAQDSGFTIEGVPGVMAGIYIQDPTGSVVPALGELKVRQALAMAFDRDAFVKNVLGGWGTVTTQLYNDQWPGYDKSLDSQYAYDPAKAKQLLAEAGYPDGFTMQMIDFGKFTPWFPFIQQSLADIGVTVEEVPVADANSYSEGQSGKYAAQLVEPAPGSALQALNATKESGNPFPWALTDPIYGPLIEKLSADPSDEAANVELAQHVFDDQLFIIFAAESTTYGMKSGLTFGHKDNWFPFLIDIQPKS